MKTLTAYNPILHKTVLPVKNVDKQMLFALLEAMFAQVSDLTATIKATDKTHSTLITTVSLPDEKPIQIEVKLIEKRPAEENSLGLPT